MRNLSRRWFMAGAAGAAAVLGGSRWKALGQETAGVAIPGPDGAGNLALINGSFVDYRGTVGSALTIRNGRIQDVDPTGLTDLDTRVIDLEGRTVIPGFVDSHVHYTRAGVNRRLSGASDRTRFLDHGTSGDNCTTRGICAGGRVHHVCWWLESQAVRRSEETDQDRTGRRRARSCGLYFWNGRRHGGDSEQPGAGVLRG